MATILFIEDDEKMHHIFVKLLTLNNYTVEIAVNGEEGIVKAKKVNPHLILLDIMMPVMNGIDVLKQLKKDVSTQNIPVLMLSNLDDEITIKEAITHGAEGYMIKSEFTPEIILAEIERVLNS